jgi:hypothetical protein
MFDRDWMLASVAEEHKAHVAFCLNNLIMYGQGVYRIDQLGGFLQALVGGNLMDAAGRADDTNRRYLFEYASFMYNEMPSDKINLQRRELIDLKRSC